MVVAEMEDQINRQLRELRCLAMTNDETVRDAHQMEINPDTSKRTITCYNCRRPLNYPNEYFYARRDSDNRDRSAGAD